MKFRTINNAVVKKARIDEDEDEEVSLLSSSDDSMNASGSDEGDSAFEMEYKRKERLRSLFQEYQTIFHEYEVKEKDYGKSIKCYSSIYKSLISLSQSKSSLEKDIPLREMKVKVLKRAIHCGFHDDNFDSTFSGFKALLSIDNENFLASNWLLLHDHCIRFKKWQMALIALEKALSIDPFVKSEHEILASFFTINFHLGDHAKCSEIVNEAAESLDNFSIWSRKFDKEIKLIESSLSSSFSLSQRCGMENLMDLEELTIEKDTWECFMQVVGSFYEKKMNLKKPFKASQLTDIVLPFVKISFLRNDEIGKNDIDMAEKEPVVIEREEVTNEDDGGDQESEDIRSTSRQSVRHSSRVKDSQKGSETDLQDCNGFLSEFIPDDYSIFNYFQKEFTIKTSVFGPLPVSHFFNYIEEILASSSKKLKNTKIRVLKVNSHDEESQVKSAPNISSCPSAHFSLEGQGGDHILDLMLRIIIWLGKSYESVWSSSVKNQFKFFFQVLAELHILERYAMGLDAVCDIDPIISCILCGLELMVDALFDELSESKLLLINGVKGWLETSPKIMERILENNDTKVRFAWISINLKICTKANVGDIVKSLLEIHGLYQNPIELVNCSYNNCITKKAIDDLVKTLKEKSIMDELKDIFSEKKYSDVIRVLDEQFDETVIDSDAYVWKLNVRERLGFLKLLILSSKYAKVSFERQKNLCFIFLDDVFDHMFEDKLSASFHDLLFVSEQLYHLVVESFSLKTNECFSESQVCRIFSLFKLSWDLFDSQIMYQIDPRMFGYIWILVYSVIKRSWSKSKTVVEESIDVEQVIVDFLMVGHEKLGGRGICTSEGNSDYLSFTLEELMNLSYAKSHEEVSQCLYCLYGHKLNCDSNVKLMEHDVLEISNTIPVNLLERFFLYLKPHILESLEQGSAGKYDMRNMFQELSALIPKPWDKCEGSDSFVFCRNRKCLELLTKQKIEFDTFPNFLRASFYPMRIFFEPMNVSPFIVDFFRIHGMIRRQYLGPLKARSKRELEISVEVSESDAISSPMRGDSWINLAQGYLELAWEGMLPDSKTSVTKVKSLLMKSHWCFYIGRHLVSREKFPWHLMGHVWFSLVAKPLSHLKGCISDAYKQRFPKSYEQKTWSFITSCFYQAVKQNKEEWMHWFYLAKSLFKLNGRKYDAFLALGKAMLLSCKNGVTAIEVCTKFYFKLGKMMMRDEMTIEQAVSLLGNVDEVFEDKENYRPQRVKTKVLEILISRLETLKREHDKNDDYHRLTYAIAYLIHLKGAETTNGEDANPSNYKEIVFRKLNSLFNIKRTAKLSMLVNIYMTPHERYGKYPLYAFEYLTLLVKVADCETLLVLQKKLKAAIQNRISSTSNDSAILAMIEAKMIVGTSNSNVSGTREDQEKLLSNNQEQQQQQQQENDPS